MRQTLGIAVFRSGMLGVTLFGIFLTPVFFYVIEWFSELWPFNTPEAKHAGKLGGSICSRWPTFGGRSASCGGGRPRSRGSGPVGRSLRERQATHIVGDSLRGVAGDSRSGSRPL